jgi:signal transduction histidine kinase/CheY-like chemotaxis protein
VDPVYPRSDWERRWTDFEERREPNTAPFETVHRRKDGSTFPVEVLPQHLHLAEGSLDVAYVRDITERNRLEGQLRHAQRMESVGRLAGGVAHDFNNLLTAISGHVELALLDLRPSDPLHELLTEVHRAAESAADLTRGLLAFSRKQVIDPRVVNLNGIVDGLQRMLKRLLREDVDLQVVLDPALWQTRVDRGQLEQILVNLAVNARDAMPNGGKLTIETANITLDAEYARTHPYVSAGDYVMLAVSDEGTGMSEEAKAHLFEPFFTTKELGKGTGLGLAMVYGAVKQNRGSIEVYSELGHGTTIKVYLPRVDAPEEPLPAVSPTRLPHGTETIMLVEDEAYVRAVAVQLLTRQGYTVHAFASGAEALRALPGMPGPLHLLITDLVLPGMNGRVLAQRVTAIRPDIKVLYTSGYSQNVVIHHGVLDPGIEFIPKPYSIELLAQRVREVLDG